MLQANPFPEFRPIKANVTSSRMIATARKSCGNDCFRSSDHSRRETTYWDDAHVQILETILHIVPDLYPCEVAILCRKPCHEVSTWRLFNDHTILTSASQVFTHRQEILSDVAIQERFDTRNERRAPRGRSLGMDVFFMLG